MPERGDYEAAIEYLKSHTVKMTHLLVSVCEM